jgi:hypothetical protein
MGMPTLKLKKGNNDGEWLPADQVEGGVRPAPGGKGKKKVFRVLTARGRQEREWLDSGLWQPLQETIIPAEAKAPRTTVYYGTYGSDGMRHDGPAGGSYSSVFDQYAMQGGDLYTNDEVRRLKQWDTRKPFPGFDPKLGSKTLDIYSED